MISIYYRKERLGDLWNDRQVMPRSGTPLRIEHLERVAFQEAAVLILPGADFAEQSPDAVDAETIKTLLSVSKHIRSSASHYPLAAAGERGLIALGLQQGAGADARVELNPDREAKWRLAPGDKILVLATFDK